MNADFLNGAVVGTLICMISEFFAGYIVKYINKKKGKKE